jgi:hypothetical protein
MMRTVRERGQAMVEFALVAGLFVLFIGGVIQFGAILWSQNTVTHIARDTARWAATQSTTPCDSGPSRAAVGAKADQLAEQWSLLDHAAGEWTNADPLASMGARGVGAEWPIPSSPPHISPPVAIFATDCPPSDNLVPWFIRVRINHTVPILIPGLQFISQCAAPGFCISSTAEVRMEPKSP